MSRTVESAHRGGAAVSLAVATIAWCLGALGCGGSPSMDATGGGEQDTTLRAFGVCPPFPLRDETGAVINPVRGINDTVPYSPKQTCGGEGCHDYTKITEGFHFTQGKGEVVPALFAARYQWATSPGNYGGTWCSPAPLYRQLAPKRNRNARAIDLTSFDFVTATCGNCHPGGGPLEFDRDGKRYDQWMADPASGFVPGGDNGLDGDYYKARWSETGVIEADCLLCHMPEYDLKARNSELGGLNFRWAATAGAGFGTVTGKVTAGDAPAITYDKAQFDADGNVIVHIAPEPRNETCLGCHFKPDWKKRGAAYSTRTDVHMVAGLRCVDCHAAGSRAADPRIRGREEHQFGKGDDPSGWVRNDLDNTVRTCESCHLEAWRNSPRATHAWLPPLHMEKIACQTCHIPTRAVKSALVQASDVYNPAPRITPPPKHIWTFYDQDMAFWNHYGELELFTGKDEPTNVTRPTLIRYKGKIYPANRVHSAWVGFEEQEKPGLNQLFMKDFFQMWTKHRADPTGKYPELAMIADDNRDGIIEVNRPEEIDALLASTKTHLAAAGFPMEGRRLVWVSDSRLYYSSEESRDLPREGHEATPYASVYKFSHDIAPAKAALGSGGCIDCHRAGSPFFRGRVLSSPFGGEGGAPVWVEAHEVLGVSGWSVRLGEIREATVKPLLYLLLGLNAIIGGVLVLTWAVTRRGIIRPRGYRRWVLFSGILIAGVVILRRPDLTEYMIVDRFALDAKHFWVALATVILGAIVALESEPRARAGRRSGIAVALALIIGLATVSGGLVLLDVRWAGAAVRLSYTVFDLSLMLIAAISVVALLRFLYVVQPRGASRLDDDPAASPVG